MVKTVWEYSAETEALRLLHNTRAIANGFFRTNHFLVLPPGTPARDNIVITPDLPYLSIPRFWERSARVNVIDHPKIGITAPIDLVNQAAKLLKDANLPKVNYAKIERDWSAVQDSVLHKIYELVPSKKGWVKQITIWPTQIGTTCSFNLLYKPGTVHIWLRTDQSISAIVEAILTSLTRVGVYEQLDGLWNESEMIVDWLLTFSPLAKLLPTTPKTIKAIRSVQDATLQQASQEFLRKIGAPTVNSTTIRSLSQENFTAREKEIFNLLLSKSPSLVTVDEVAEILFANNPDAFSLYAIAKTIQRLRDKLEKNGVSGSYIQTKRGEGYLLIN